MEKIDRSHYRLWSARRNATAEATTPRCPLSARADDGTFTAQKLVSRSESGSLVYGARIGIAEARCALISRICSFVVICSEGFGVGASLDLSALLGVVTGAQCADDTAGISSGPSGTFGAGVMAGEAVSRSRQMAGFQRLEVSVSGPGEAHNGCLPDVQTFM
jgi:hypothetical protein